MTDAILGDGTRPQKLVAAAILVLILAFSAFIQFSVVYRTVVDEPLRADASEYFSYAYNLSHYGVYSIENTWADSGRAKQPTPDNIRPPGYPIFLLLAGIPEPTAKFLLRVSLLQATLGVLSVWLSYLLASQVMRAGFALIVAFLTAISPHAATMSTYLLSESLFLFLLLASTLVLLRAMKAKRLSVFALAGALWGLTCLVRSTAIFFPIFLVSLVFLTSRLRPYRKEAFATLLGFLTVLSPWVIRNQSPSVQKPGSSLLVKALSHGSYPNFMYEDQPATFGFPYAYDPGAEMATRSLPSVLGDIAGKFRSQPGKYFHWFLLGKPYFFLSMENVQGFDVLIYPTISTPYYEDVRFAVLRWLGVELHLPLMVLGATGLLFVFIRPAWLGLAVEQQRAAIVVALLIAYAIVFHMIVAPFPRYAIPFRPCLYILGVLVLQALWLKFFSGNEADGRRQSPAVS